jgi:UbiD family decarboxylase
LKLKLADTSKWIGLFVPDLRAWLAEVEKLGQLMTVENVHWDLALSTLTEIINEGSKNRHALLFDQIKDYPKGYRVAANLVSSVDRLALTLGMEPTCAVPRGPAHAP